MRVLHTSDWHLGRSFHRVGLLGAQAAYLQHLVEVVRSERVDAVLVAGDVYDRALPAPETVELLDETLVRLTDAGAQVVLSSGNHDSAIRLGFGSRLLAKGGVHIRTDLASIGRPVLVGDLAVYPLPYLEPSLAADRLGAVERTHAEAIAAAMQRVRTDVAARGGPSVVMAHAFVTGAATSDSERDISVGGVSAVHPGVFAGIDYVALGHLHGRQRVSETVRYSGSPLPLSFSEAGHTKGAWLVDVSRSGVRVSEVTAPVPRALATMRGQLEDLLRDSRYTAAETAYCQVTLTDTLRPLAAMERLRRRFPHTLVLRFDPQRADGPTPSYGARTRQRADLDLCCDFLAHVRAGAAANRPERLLLSSALEGSRACLDEDAERWAVEDRGEGAAVATVGTDRDVERGAA